MRGVVVDPVPGTLNRRRGRHDQILLGQSPVCDGLVETGDDHGADAVTHILAEGESTRNLEVGVDEGGGHQRREGAGARQRHPAGADRIDGHGVGAREFQSPGRFPAAAVGGDRTGYRVAPVVEQGNLGDPAVEHVDRGPDRRAETLGAVEGGQAHQRRPGRGRRVLLRGRGGRRRLAATGATGNPRDVAGQHSEQQRDHSKAHRSRATREGHRHQLRVSWVGSSLALKS